MGYAIALSFVFSCSETSLPMKNFLKIERARHDLTQDDLAKKIGVSRQTINSIEKNRYVPSTLLALKLSQIFGKSVNEIFMLEEGD